MKGFRFILCIITLALFLSACRSVTITPANELTSSLWQVKNPSSVSANLSFDTDLNTVTFNIIDELGESATISGVFAIDSENLYITSDAYCKTYIFGYRVYADRLILTYQGYELTFEAKEKEP